MKMRDLSIDEMERFGRWLSIGLASRPGTRGRRQKNVMAGMWNAWSLPTAQGQGGLRLRKTDFTLRVSLLVHGFHRVGLTIEKAADRVGEYPFGGRQLGSRKRSNSVQEEVGFGPTLRTGYYYPFLRENPNLGQIFELWWGIYLYWKDSIVSEDPGTIRFITERYRGKGQDEVAEEFLLLVEDIQAHAKPESPDQLEERFRAREQTLVRSLDQAKRIPSPLRENATQPLAEVRQGAVHPDVLGPAMTTANLAILYHRHRRWSAASVRYQDAYDLYGSPLVSPRVQDLMLPWFQAQIERCRAEELPDRMPILGVSSRVASGRAELEGTLHRNRPRR